MRQMDWMLLAVLSAVHCEFVQDEADKFGCLLLPDICTPPEDCDGLTGSCQMPYNIDWRYKEPNPSFVDFVRDLRLRGQDMDYDSVIHALLYRHLLEDWQREPRRDVAIDYNAADDSLHRFLTTLKRKKRAQDYVPREMRRSVDSSNHPFALLAPEKDADELSTTKSELRLQHIKELVKKVKVSLAEKGKEFSDLTPYQVEMLARYLAKRLKKEEQEGEAIGDTESANLGLGEIENDLRQNSDDEVGGLKAAKPQQAPQVMSDSAATVEESKLDVARKSEMAIMSSANLEEDAESSHKVTPHSDTFYIALIVVGATILLIVLVTIISCIVYAYRMKHKEKQRLISGVASDETQPLGSEYEELCRQHYASKNSEVAENRKEIINSGSTLQDPLITRACPLTKPTGNGPGPLQPAVTRRSSASSVSWSEEPVTANLDIMTGHAILSYMEDHLRNKDRLDQEWEEICTYEADGISNAAAITPQNSRKNRSVVALPYDHNRVMLKPENNHLQSDYVNASTVIDNDPKRPLYIATQGPLPSTIPDFWQMMWEQGCVAIVMLTPLVEEGVNQCARYWPDEGSCTYHNFEIHLVSEHIWCEDYLVRSLYLKHLGTGEARTVTQFHFLSWPKDRVPSTPKPLLELRRKVTKCYKGHNSPVLVHCSDGVGRTGTYILLDLAIDRMLKGAKEIDIAATLEHIRDQRVGMVANREQFEYALTAVAEEVNAILKTLLH